MPTTLISADNLFAIKLEPGLEEILADTSLDKSDKNEKSVDRNEENIGDCLEAEEEEEENNVEGEEEEGFSFYDANAPKVTITDFICTINFFSLKVDDCSGVSF